METSHLLQHCHPVDVFTFPSFATGMHSRLFGFLAAQPDALCTTAAAEPRFQADYEAAVSLELSPAAALN